MTGDYSKRMKSLLSATISLGYGPKQALECGDTAPPSVHTIRKARLAEPRGKLSLEGVDLDADLSDSIRTPPCDKGDASIVNIIVREVKERTCFYKLTSEEQHTALGYQIPVGKKVKELLRRIAPAEWDCLEDMLPPVVYSFVKAYSDNPAAYRRMVETNLAYLQKEIQEDIEKERKLFLEKESALKESKAYVDELKSSLLQKNALLKRWKNYFRAEGIEIDTLRQAKRHLRRPEHNRDKTVKRRDIKRRG